MATLSFWGGVGTVTGSKFLLDTDRARILVDAGMFQGLKELRELNWKEPPFDPRTLNAILLTHAHIDHTGYLPRLVKHGYDGPVFCSRGTADLLKILLPDAGRLQEEDADYRNRHQITKHQPALPLYTEKDAFASLKLLEPVANKGEPVPVAPGIRASFRISGHILGSSLVLAEVENRTSSTRILFSGDLGHYGQPIIPDPLPPPDCEYLLIESTYGDRLHDPEDPKDALKRIIQDAFERQAPLLIPAFAVGRTQELIYLIRELEDEDAIPILPVFVDSPMAAAATMVYATRTEEQDEEYATVLKRTPHPLKTRNMSTTTSKEQSKHVNDMQGARIIISASGMMTGGRVLHHALRLVPDPEATLLFVGYQAAGTLGRRIVNREPEVKILGQWVPVRCRIAQIGGFSAHADWKEIIQWMEKLSVPPRKTFLTHGESRASNAMALHIRERFGWNVELPAFGDKFKLE